ncbi:MAG: alpha/beta hydrolase [Novosphingobium sp.]|nr:alpha/beta hydrolase [Novosphingobium sp.]
MSARLDLPPERTGYPAPPDLAARRAMMDAALAAGQWTVEPQPRERTLAGRRVLRFAPPGESRGRVLHFHGGAFRLGGPEMEGPFAIALAARCGVELIAPQYRLAPEHPFPAGLNDGWAVLEAVASENDGPMVLSGDSAGGGLAASLAVRAVEAGVPLAGLVLLSPWLDLTVSAPAYAENSANDPLFSHESATSGAELYLQGIDPRHPLASPLFADHRGFPPTLISVGTGEVLRDDALRLDTSLGAAGVTTRLVALDRMEHVAVVRDLASPGAAETFRAIAAFVDDIIARH